jgi:hypothetical protein
VLEPAAAAERRFIQLDTFAVDALADAVTDALADAVAVAIQRLGVRIERPAAAAESLGGITESSRRRIAVAGVGGAKHTERARPG